MSEDKTKPNTTVSMIGNGVFAYAGPPTGVGPWEPGPFETPTNPAQPSMLPIVVDPGTFDPKRHFEVSESCAKGLALMLIMLKEHMTTKGYKLTPDEVSAMVWLEDVARRLP